LVDSHWGWLAVLVAVRPAPVGQLETVLILKTRRPAWPTGLSRQTQREANLGFGWMTRTLAASSSMPLGSRAFTARPRGICLKVYINLSIESPAEEAPALVTALEQLRRLSKERLDTERDCCTCRDSRHRPVTSSRFCFLRCLQASRFCFFHSLGLLKLPECRDFHGLATQFRSPS